MTTPSYQVFSRKYRPQAFSDLIGHETLVQVLGNALRYNRMPHALLLCGVRGVGKTTIARLIAKAVNCTNRNDEAGSIDPCNTCPSCKNILDDRNLDVIEMDAASRTSVENIRDIITNIYYKPVAAKYKVQIIDEVHMLSKQAFNALLKSIEEPPEHILFIFATTEPDRIPDTVLSRCVRFELSPLSVDHLLALFASVLAREEISADPRALRLIADAAGGSARDGLSLLERAVGLSYPESVTHETVLEMLGAADQQQLVPLLEALLSGQCQEALRVADTLTAGGLDPVRTLQDCACFIHSALRAKVAPDLMNQNTRTDETTKAAITSWARDHSVPQLHRFWTAIIRSLEDVKIAPNTQQAFELVLMRLCYLSFVPPATSGAAGQEHGGQSPTSRTSAGVPQSPAPVSPDLTQVAPQAESSVDITRFDDILALCSRRNESLLRAVLIDSVRLLQFDPVEKRMHYALVNPADQEHMQRLRRLLHEYTGAAWVLKQDESGATTVPGQDTVKEQRRQAHEALVAQAMETPLVKSAFEHFTDAEIIDIKRCDT